MGGKTQNMSVDELRAQISQRLRSSAAFSKTVYQEQPIIMTGAQLKSFTPDPIREARQLARNAYAQGKDVAAVFYEQARLLAGYEDDCEYAGTFSQYYPTYEDMSNEQLRGYFAWRTQARAGNVTQGSLSFSYVYLYELFNLIGVADALEGYETLKAFGSAYRRFDKRFGQLFDAWLNDFVIYYDLDSSLLNGIAHRENDAAFDVLLNRTAHTRDELFDALCQLSGYTIKQSPFYLEHEDELEQLVVHGYRVAADHHDQKLTTTLAAKLSGKLSKQRIWLFERAIFADPLDIQSTSYAISPHDTVFCRTGAWFRVHYKSLEGTLPWVTDLLETCEHALREAYQYPNTLAQSITTKYLSKAIDAQAQAIVEEKRAREARAVRIDFSQLDSIRSAANETCEKLIVEEEETVVLPGVTMGSGLTVTSCEQDVTVRPDPIVTPAQNDDLLDPQERELLRLLLEGGDLREFERANACIVSVLVDSINEKLYDEFADICIDSASPEPAIIEDYREDLRALLGMD